MKRIDRNRETVDDHLHMLKLHYDNIPKNLKLFCEQFQLDLNYNEFCREFARNWSTGVDGLHPLCIRLLRILLNTDMIWPDDSIPTMRVKDLPRDDKEMVIDYVGFLIGLPQGHGNYSLIGLYLQYKADLD